MLFEVAVIFAAVAAVLAAIDVLHTNPVPDIHVNAFVDPLQEGTASADGLAAVVDPRIVFAACDAKLLAGNALTRAVTWADVAAAGAAELLKYGMPVIEKPDTAVDPE